MRISIVSTAIVLLLFPVRSFAAPARLNLTQTSVATGSVPKGAQRVALLRIDVSASCAGAGSVRELTLLHEGLGDASAIDRVYVTDGQKRLTRARAIDGSDGTVRLRFIPALTVAACTSRSLTVAADFSGDASASGEHRLSIELQTDVISDDALVTVTANDGAAPAVVRPKNVGTVTATVEGTNKPLRYGADRTLARIRVEADGEADQEIRSMMLTNRGKATDDDLRNLRIQSRKGAVLTNVAASMDGDAVRLTFDPPFRLGRNDAASLELKGDVRAGKRRTVRFVLEEPSDTEAFPAAR